MAVAITTVASAGGPLGTIVTDTATLSGGFDAVGVEITFILHEYADGVCGAIVFSSSSTTPVTGDGVYESEPFEPEEEGTYCWIAQTGGNSSGNPATACGDPDELVTIGQTADSCSIVLQFFNASNTGVQYLTSLPGATFDRFVEFDIGTGGTFYDYVGASNRSAIYNAHDDKMYFLAHKQSPVAGNFLIQFDPRTLTVSNEMELPVGWVVDDTFVTLLLDCTDERAWILHQDDGDLEVRAFDTVTMTQVFTDSGAFSATPYTNPYALISCGNGIILLQDDMDATIVHRVTVTGPTTFTDTTITCVNPILWISIFDNGLGSYRRLWNQTLNRTVVIYEDGFGGELIDVAGATATPFDFNATWAGSNFHVADIEDYSIWWDVFSGTHRIVGAASLDGQFGIAIFDADGTQQGVCCRGQASWDSSAPAMPLGDNLVWSVKIGGAEFFEAGGFSLLESDPSPGDDPPAELYPSLEGIVFFDDYTQVCIAPCFPTTTPTMTTVASAGGSVGTALTDSATLSGGDSPTGTITFFLFGPDDDTCGLEPIFTSDAITVAGNGTYVSTPTYTPVVAGTYRWTAAYSGDDNNDPIETECNAINETSIIVEVSPPQGGGGSPGNCGVQFERLELFHMLKSLMGGGRTLKEALKFVDQDDIDFLEEEGYMDDLPLEIPKPMRQGASPKMVSTRIDLTPITKLNRLIDEFETKLQDCVHRSVGEYEK